MRKMGKKELGEAIKKIVEKCEKEWIIVGGDFNIRTGELRGDEEEGGSIRKSKDKTIRNGSKKLIDLIQGIGLEILNDKTEGDWEEEYTYI